MSEGNVPLEETAISQDLVVYSRLDDIHRVDQPLPVTGIARLPAELLLTIFVLATELEQVWWDWLWDEWKWSDALCIAQTCSLWRRIMLACGAAWGDIVLQDREVADLFAKMSQNTLLSLYSHDADWQMQFIRTHWSRTQECTISSFSPLAATRNWQWLTNQGAPNLRRFLCEIDHGSGQLIIPYLFAQNTPKLRELSLTHCRLAYVAGNYKNLTKLGLNVNSPRRRLPYEGTILTAIINSPRLESLSINTWATGERWDPETEPLPLLPLPHDKRFHLNHLRKLVIDLSFPYVALILGSVLLPGPDTLVHIDLITDYPFQRSTCFKAADLLKSDCYFPSTFFSNLHSCAFSSNVLQNKAEWPVLNLHGEGLCRGHTEPDPGYVIRIAFSEEPENVVEALEGCLLKNLTTLDYYSYVHSDMEATAKSYRTVPVSSLLKRAQNVRDLNINAGTYGQGPKQNSLYFPPFYGHPGVSPDSVHCQNIERLDILIWSCWSLRTLHALAEFCKTLPHLKHLALTVARVCFDTEEECEAIFDAMQRFGINHAHREQRQMQVPDPETFDPRPRDVDLRLFLNNEENYQCFEPLFERAKFT